MAPTSKKKTLHVATDILSGVGVSAEEVVFRAKFLQNIKSRTPDMEKRPLLLYLKQKNAEGVKGWLRKALYPDASGRVSDYSEKREILNLSAALTGTTNSTKIVADAWGISDQSVRNTWEAASSVATTNKLDCSKSTTSTAAPSLLASSSSDCIAQIAVRQAAANVEAVDY
jgi:hypothetical protein